MLIVFDSLNGDSGVLWCLHVHFVHLAECTSTNQLLVAHHQFQLQYAKMLRESKIIIKVQCLLDNVMGT